MSSSDAGPTDKAFCGWEVHLRRPRRGRGENGAGLKGGRGRGWQSPRQSHGRVVAVDDGSVAGAQAGSEAGKGGA